MAQTLGKPLVMRMNLNQQSRGKEWQTHKALLDSMSPIVDCGVHYPTPLNKQPIIEELLKPKSCPVSEKLSQTILSLPMHPYLSEADLEKVVEGVERVALGMKERALESLAKCLGLEPRQCVSVGDSDWDASFLAASGFGVAYGRGEHDKLDKAAKVKIENLTELLEYL